ncbi:MAG: FG-GAP-like repeat-containing protein [Bacteroidia bacterium]
MKLSRILLLSYLSFLAFDAAAQPFVQWDNSIPVSIGGTPLLNAWAGGLNFIQSSNIDLNMDGIKDVVMFDKTGNKVRTFVNQGTTPGAVGLIYDPQYESRFPKVSEWMLLKDYNGDGKEDIFTYSIFGGGFDIYKNTSTATTLQFTKVVNLLRSDYNAVTKASTSSVVIPDAGVVSTWDGVAGTPGVNYAKSNIAVSGLTATNWDIKFINLNIVHPNDNDLIVYIVNPCGGRMRLIKNAGGSGSNFINTSFSHYNAVTGVIGSAGYNTAPFTSTYVPEAGPSAWAAFLACGTPNGTWSLNVGDDTGGSAGTISNWGISFWSSGPNLYVSSADIPALSDIDNDGDVDVVTFSIMGTFLEYHKNLSMEYYGTPDSLRFQEANRCWGYAAENALSNDYTLHDTCPSNVSVPEFVPDGTELRDAERHSGSCELCIDLNNDNVKEFIVGDISFANLTMLTNGGTPTDGSFIAKDIAFPSHSASTTALDLDIFPCAFYLDCDYDGTDDLIVSPSAAGVSENFNSVVWYKNTGTESLPDFEFQQSNFLQDNMIEVGEGAYPVFFDYNNDGLLDLFVGNYGYYTPGVYSHQIALFKNTGTATSPKFDLVTRDYDGFDGTATPLSSLGIGNMVPAFGDMDGDGDADMIIGGMDGKIHYFRNTAAPGATCHFVLSAANLQNSSGRVIDVGDYAVPLIADMDGGGTNDVVVGGRNGKLAYFRHTGATMVPALDSITYNFGGVNVCLPGYFTGYSYPALFKQGGVTNLFVGEESGYIRRYNNIDGNLSGIFTWVDSTYMNIFQGTRTAPATADINGDGFLDLVVGNYEGGLSFYSGTMSITTNDRNNILQFDFDVFPNPSSGNFTVRMSGGNNKKYHMQLYNVMGQMMMEEDFISDELKISSQDMNSGIYLCKISEVGADGKQLSAELTKRIVVQK